MRTIPQVGDVVTAGACKGVVLRNCYKYRHADAAIARPNSWPFLENKAAGLLHLTSLPKSRLCEHGFA